jgi:Ferritin-like domain
MVPNRIMRGRAVRCAALVAVVAAALAGCGGAGSVTTAVPDKESDARVLNEILGRQLAAIAAYGRSMGALDGPERVMARQFRSQEQEHVDAVTKVMRGLGAESEPREEEIAGRGLKSEADYLAFLYEVESATIDEELHALSRLTASWARPLLGTIVANQAEHLVLLRRALGAQPLEAVPEAFEDGTTPPPSRHAAAP